jgi:hypothetical protein
VSKIIEALALYRSMVKGGEQESPESIQMMTAAREEEFAAQAQVDSMLDHIKPENRLDDLNGKLTQVSNWLAGQGSEPHCLRAEFEETINRHCAENGSDTPDFILAEYLSGCLGIFDRTLRAREHWYGRKLTMEAPGAVAGWMPTPKQGERAEMLRVIRAAHGTGYSKGVGPCICCYCQEPDPDAPMEDTRELLQAPPFVHVPAPEACAHIGPQYGCTLPHGHPGLHVALGSDQDGVLAAWPDPTPDPTAQ